MMKLTMGLAVMLALQGCVIVPKQRQALIPTDTCVELAADLITILNGECEDYAPVLKKLNDRQCYEQEGD